MIKWVKQYWKILYYLLVLAILSILALVKLPVYLNGSPQVYEIILFLIWIAVLIAPLFREVSFFGVSLKNEIDSLRNDLNKQIINLRSDIHNTVNTRTEINPQIQLLIPPTDSDIKNFMQTYKPVLDQMKESAQEKPTPKIEIPDDNKYLIEVRYTLEKELRRIWGQLQASAKEIELWTGQKTEFYDRPQSFFQMVRFLTELGPITSQLSNLLREVYRTCSPAVHGEEVSQTAIGFVRDVAPGLITSLQAVNVTIRPSPPKDKNQ